MGISTTKKEEEEKNKNKNTTSREFKIVWTNFVSKYRAHLRTIFVSTEPGSKREHNTPRLLNTTSVSPKRANLAAED